MGKAMARAEAERGREADYPSEVPALGWRDILLRAWEQVGTDNISMIAAGVAFYGLLAIFPAITALVSIWGLVADPAQLQSQFATIRQIVPAEAWELLDAQLRSVAASSPRALGWGVALGILVALWSAGAGVRALINALNIAYDEEEKRGFIKLYAVGFLFTVGLISAAAVALIVIVAVPVVLQFLPLGGLTNAAIRGLTWLVLAGLVIAGLAVLYRYAPSRSHARLRWVTWGAIGATILWVVASFLFQVYAANFANYNATYGSLGAVIALLMWFWVSAFVVLFGAELNAEMEHQTRKDTTTGPEKPLGERGAYVADDVGKVP
jgi:membrane protein